MNWNPYTTYVWTLKELKAFYDRFGTTHFYNGQLWRLKTKRLCPDRYEIKSVLVNP